MNTETNRLSPQQEDELISSAFEALLDGYVHSNHRQKTEIIKRAYAFARQAHQGVRRRSGEPYIMHPIAVATIVSQEIGLGSTSICSALLHDVVEDTDYTVEDIEAQFGGKIARIVDGLTKISGGIFGDMSSTQAENVRKLLLTMGDDIRVVLIKMADRLHNMRTLASMPPQKQFKIAGETLYLYAPLAHRLGLFAIKTELEDLSFKYEHPEIYRQIEEKIATTADQRNQVFNRFAAPIRERLDQMGMHYEFKARVKSCYSIWKKMERKHVPFEEVYDLYAARIVFECTDDSREAGMCWDIYNAIAAAYPNKFHTGRLRDWVVNPKANGYRALHVTVMGPDGNWVEVQIRSQRMDDVDEHGLAAHWKYKIGTEVEDTALTAWLQTVQDILKNPEPNALDFLDTIKLNLFASEIQVFTPKGDLLRLPKDATVLDMAFNLHSEIGTHCIAGKVNHKLVPLSQRLNNGDQVEVLTSHSQTPQAEWEQFLVTARGKTRLRAALRHQRREIINQGENKLRNWLMANGVEMTSDTLMRIINNEHAASKDELFFMIGNGEIAVSDQLLRKVKPQQGGGLFDRLWRNPFGGTRNKQPETTEKPEVNTREVYELRTDGGVSNYQIAPCCRPIPGDDVVGCIDDNGQVVVHKLECPTAMLLKAGRGGRLVQTRWASTGRKFPASLHVEGIDRMGILQEIIYIISTNMAIYMRSLNINANQGVFKCDLDVLIEDTSVITNLCKRLKKVKGVSAATRIN
ncbi:MAG: bifunctional (p)ppGpp synthetase/guanosine-3',5'-bis(diphosphate) 3'-pyrophosphohydrolase [Muribaculaceae bacterium]|nr:bifunctional (p)ppGpp synthetase/guanosine-3',5'-bis(diphosphate) 3'-pyrophosphohydrolase [Muribaculaceae bacterium]